MTDRKITHTWSLDDALSPLDDVLSGARAGISQTLQASDGAFRVSFTPAPKLVSDAEAPTLTPEEYEHAFGRSHPEP
jgi:hypothetical protein